ncbi:Archaetidylserine synthase [ANME-1 cluster archaeon GoMg2]|nr:Archaetidylserine synthase [ANME-1 cluster archaeon GoMg2]
MVIRRGSNINTDSILQLIKLPDLLSVCNALFGFAAILFVLEGRGSALKTALVFILVAALIDGLDGLAARTVESSPIGKYLDSLADMISFGVAPAMVAFALLNSNLSYTHVVYAFCGAYVVCGMLRLARFNAQTMPQTDFDGLPITGSAIFLAAFMLMAIELDFPSYPSLLIVLMGILCILMISRIPYRKVRDIRIMITAGIVVSTLFFFYAFYLPLFVYPAAIIVALTAVYIGSPIMPRLLNRDFKGMHRR